MTEMTEKDGDAKIRKGLSARRDSTSYQIQQDVVIPAGTILRSIGNNRFSAPVDRVADFTITMLPGDVLPNFKRVISS